MLALDIETAPVNETDKPYALEPFRYKQGLAIITSVAIAGNDILKQITDMRELPEMLSKFSGETIFCHNTIFDITWMLAVCGNFELIKNINWMDTSLLAKWVLNSQATEYGTSTHHNSTGRFSFSLVNLCKTFLPDHPKLEEFISVKDEKYEAGKNKQYWLERGCLDATMTFDLAKKLKNLLPEEQRRGFLIEQGLLPYVSRAWLNGINFDRDKVEELRPKICDMKSTLLSKLNIEGTVITSPLQLGNYLFNDLGMVPINKTAKGKGSTSAGDLKLLESKYHNTEKGTRLKLILQYKKLATLESKYLKGFNEVYNYVGEAKVYALPKIFSTYTGRFTYSSKTLRKGNYKTSIALHQIPRKGPVKSCLVAPLEKTFILNDASQQELRLIGQLSQDYHLIDGFNSGIDLHSSMASYISGEEYNEFCKKLHNGDEETKNIRYAGKLLNLSCQYRIGSKSLKKKFFETYDIDIPIQTAQMYLNFYKKRYPGVVKYWNDAILKVRKNGYANTIANRRYGISEWTDKKWMSESSSINTPIQGSAADHKEASLLQVCRNFPEAEFVLDIHDELVFSIPENNKEMAKDILHFMNKIDYESMWNKNLSLKLPFDSFISNTFVPKEEIK